MAYSIALLAVTAWALVSAVRTGRGGLFRCAGAVLIHFAAYKAMTLLGEPWHSQPWFTNIVMLLAVFFVVIMHPRDKWHAVIGGVIGGGILASLAYGANTLWNGYTARADWVYWLALFGMGNAVLAILLGWTHEQVLRHLVGSLRGAFDGMVQRFGRRGVAG